MGSRARIVSLLLAFLFARAAEPIAAAAAPAGSRHLTKDKRRASRGFMKQEAFPKRSLRCGYAHGAPVLRPAGEFLLERLRSRRPPGHGFNFQDHRQFKQRYFEFLDYHRAPGGPVFLRICGESACDGIPNDYLAESLNARYNRSGFDNPWFVIGISYSGALSAWFRLKFPHLTCGSLASSGVVLAVYNYIDFDKQVGESAGPECKAVLQEITELVDEQLRLDSHSVKALFGAQTLKNDGDFLFFLADAAAITFQYGNPDALCPQLIEAKKNKKNLVEAYAQFVKDFYIKKMETPPSSYDREYLKETTPDDSGSRLWWFQVCSEVAYFQVAPKNDSVRSARINTKYHLDLCRNVFGEGVYPDVFMTNLYYGGTRIAASKIVFTNGSQDPWRHASKQKSSKDMPSYLMKCRNCGHGTDLRGCPQWPFRVEGDSSNCSSPAAVNAVRERIAKHIDLWLSQCNKPSVGYGSLPL
ncbi:unnamed protein product [Miscanthus lutarioriparius]|uniref:Serine carboxypeptidase S28 family protein n=1 Tax=Miscanthus lutarioriparius TaxID=422564 RepID=A0A811MJX1_9POAL|nr:unnamed protein product [Miscanthus lutarioriparius]